MGFPPGHSFCTTFGWRLRLGTVEWCHRRPPACYAPRRPPLGPRDRRPAREPRAMKLGSRTHGKLWPTKP
eukprot:scaffold95991_cov26-Phaeocystis_antarctica.AAC.1